MNTYPMEKLGTLGPCGTSSEQSALYFINKHVSKSIEIVLFDSFDEVLNAINSSRINYAIVPHAYDHIEQFYINYDLSLFEMYTFDTPVYGLFKRLDKEIPHINCQIVSHAAPVHLLPHLLNQMDIKLKSYQIHKVSSTSVAAKQVYDGIADLAITNQIAADLYKLQMLVRYGVIHMGWSVFKTRSNVS